jgi:hypothetical protein
MNTMKCSELSLRPSTRMLRQFSALWLACFLSMAAWQWLARERVVIAMVLAVLAATIGPLGLIKPSLIRPIFVGWMIVAHPIGWLVSHVMLAVLYYGLFTPLAMFFRFTRRDPLMLRRPTDATSYWSVKPAPRDVRSYFRQF